MSRGPGKWQALILARLEREGEVRLRDLLPPGTDSNSSAYKALNRAAHTLASRGLIEPPMRSLRLPWRHPPQAGYKDYLAPKSTLTTGYDASVEAMTLLDYLEAIRLRHPKDRALVYEVAQAKELTRRLFTWIEWIEP